MYDKQLKFLLVLLLLFAQSSFALEIHTMELPSGNDVDVRVFHAKGNRILLGFAFDEGQGKAEPKTAQELANDGIEVWMPDMLSSYMLPKTRSSVYKVLTEDLVYILEKVTESKKDVYLIASGPTTEVLLRLAHAWEEKYPDNVRLKGAILLFPRLNAGKPEPGHPPKYVASVGKTRIPLIVLEGERTPNRWGLRHLSKALKKGGSPVITKLVPGIRGYFYNREDPNRTEDVVTSQLSGLIKVSMFYLENAKK